MPRPSHLSPDNILRFLQVRAAPASAEQIAAALHIRKADRRPLFKMLAKLKKRRAIEEVSGERYHLPGRKSEDGIKQQNVLEPVKHSGRPGGGVASRDEVKGRLVLHH